MLPIGLQLNGRYQVEHLIGQGGMAAVYAVTHLGMGRRFALKIISSSLVSQPAVLERFSREAKILGALDHPHIVGVIDSDVYQGQYPYLVMDLLEGEDLAQFMAANGLLPPSVALPLFLQIGRALQGAHEAGVIHRDLKPANIFVCANGVVRNHVKVLDFGIAKISQYDGACPTQGSALIGTPAYMAPEQALGDNHRIDARTDQFALAVILYEMLSGRPAFYRPGEAMLMTLSRVAYEEPEPLLDSHLWPVLQRALHKDPDRRFPSLQDFIEASGVLHLTGAQPILAYSTHPPESAPMPAEAQRAERGLGAALPPAAPLSISIAPRGELQPQWSRFWPHVAVSLVALGVLVASIGLQRGRIREHALQEQARAASRREQPPELAAIGVSGAPLAQEAPPAKVPIVISTPAEAAQISPPLLPAPPLTSPPPLLPAPLVSSAELSSPSPLLQVSSPPRKRHVELVPKAPLYPVHNPEEDAAHGRLRRAPQADDPVVLAVQGAGPSAPMVERCLRKTMGHTLHSWFGRTLYLSIDPMDGGLLIARQDPVQLPTKFAIDIEDHCLKRIHLALRPPNHKVTVDFRRPR